MKMHATIKNLAVVALTAGIGLSASTAFARQTLVHGSACVPTQASRSCVDYNQYGVYNTCSTAVTVLCSIPLNGPTNGNPIVSELTINMYDRSTTDNVNCYFQEVDVAGNPLFTWNMNSSGGGPGTGSQNLFATNQQFGNFGSDSGFWRVTCSIPGVQSGWNSIVSSMLILTSE